MHYQPPRTSEGRYWTRHTLSASKRMQIWQPGKKQWRSMAISNPGQSKQVLQQTVDRVHLMCESSTFSPQIFKYMFLGLSKKRWLYVCFRKSRKSVSQHLLAHLHVVPGARITRVKNPFGETQRVFQTSRRLHLTENYARISKGSYSQRNLSFNFTFPWASEIPLNLYILGAEYISNRSLSVN